MSYGDITWRGLGYYRIVKDSDGEILIGIVDFFPL
jgi:hypothetical protein